MRDFKNLKIAVAGTGYVGLSIATLLSQHHKVTAVDIVPEKVELINNKKSPIQDEYIEKFLTEKGLDFMRRALEECQTLNVERLMRAALSGMPDVIKYLEETPYSGGAAALSDSSSAFERWCDNRIIEAIRPQKYNSFTIGPLVAYVLARQNEIKTVRIILTGKLNHLPDDAIRERVREMYV